MWPQKAPHCIETCHMTYRSLKLAWSQEQIKRRKKSCKKPKHDTSHVRRDHPRCCGTTWNCVCSFALDVVTYSKFHRNPFRFLSHSRGLKFDHSHYFGYWLLQQLVVYRTIGDVVWNSWKVCDFHHKVHTSLHRPRKGLSSSRTTNGYTALPRVSKNWRHKTRYANKSWIQINPNKCFGSFFPGERGLTSSTLVSLHLCQVSQVACNQQSQSTGRICLIKMKCIKSWKQQQTAHSVWLSQYQDDTLKSPEIVVEHVARRRRLVGVVVVACVTVCHCQWTLLRASVTSALNTHSIITQLSFTLCLKNGHLFIFWWTLSKTNRC